MLSNDRSIVNSSMTAATLCSDQSLNHLVRPQQQRLPAIVGTAPCSAAGRRQWQQTGRSACMPRLTENHWSEESLA
jgi:hypothetical protein